MKTLLNFCISPSGSSIFKKITTALVLIISSQCTLCNASPINIPKHKDERLIIEKLNMTVETLFSTYTSGNLEQKTLAEMYIIGVIDSSEGESWCNFKTISSAALEEEVYVALKDAYVKAPKMRASTAIKARLKALVPCKK